MIFDTSVVASHRVKFRKEFHVRMVSSLSSADCLVSLTNCSTNLKKNKLHHERSI